MKKKKKNVTLIGMTIKLLMINLIKYNKLKMKNIK